jgi:hypothetical protein
MEMKREKRVCHCFEEWPDNVPGPQVASLSEYPQPSQTPLSKPKQEYAFSIIKFLLMIVNNLWEGWWKIPKHFSGSRFELSSENVCDTSIIVNILDKYLG